MADLSNAVYEDDRGVASGKIPHGWESVPKEKLEGMGLDPSQFQNDKTGFAAGLYQHEDGAYALAFRGTGEGVDWTKGNIPQGIGLDSPQYKQAVALATAVSGAVGADNLTQTGHSLGGGLAGAASLSTNTTGVTFNAAGLHNNSVGMKRGARDQLGQQLVTNYFVKGEVLSAGQKALYPAPVATGRQIGIRPANVTSFGTGRVENHYMRQVLPSMDRLRR